MPVSRIGAGSLGDEGRGFSSMQFRVTCAAKALAATACFSLIASPAIAAALPHAANRSALPTVAKTWSPADDIAANRGRGGWGRGGWGGRHHHDDGIDGGDVFAGLLILGGIAAIASAAS